MKTFILPFTALLAAGCASNQNDLAPSFGKAFSANAAAQIIDPTPAAGVPEGDGTAVDLAVARYKTDTVKKGDSGDFKPASSTDEGSN